MGVYRANDAAADYFRQTLRGSDGAAARRYLEEREVPRELWERFGLGCAPVGWDGLVSKFQEPGKSLALAEQAGLVAARQSGDGHYDRCAAECADRGGGARRAQRDGRRGDGRLADEEVIATDVDGHAVFPGRTDVRDGQVAIFVEVNLRLAFRPV